MATRGLLADLVQPGVVQDLPAVSFESAGGVDVARRLRGGELADVVILNSATIASLAEDGVVLDSHVQPLVESELVVACRDHGPAHGADVSTEATLQETLRRTEHIGHSTGPSGDALLRLLAEWENSQDLLDRLVLAQPGIPVAQLLLDGAADIGFQQRSELSEVPGVTILGTMPAGAQARTVFSGAVVAGSSAVDRAGAVLDALASDATRALIEQHGFQAAF